MITAKDAKIELMNKFTNEPNDLRYKVIGAAIEVHKNLGPGLLESAYEHCLAFELTERKINFQGNFQYLLNTKEMILIVVFVLIFSSKIYWYWKLKLWKR